jgi:circadian clock protein KaiC
MARAKRPRRKSGPATLAKAPTGVAGLDTITFGGLPRGRASLVCGTAGSGKTLFAMQFLLRGALDLGEPGVFIAFEENAEELRTNVASLGFDLDDLMARRLIDVDFVHVERSQIEETGEFSLEALFIRIAHAIQGIGAKRVVVDTIEALFVGLTDQQALRAELRRLFRWLKTQGVTSIVTAERGEGSLTRYGLEEYVADCVILLDLRLIDDIATRRARVVKYRGSPHGTDEFPFLIDSGGITLMPITPAPLSHAAPSERVSVGVPQLDEMLGKGAYRGSCILVSGTPGTGKTSFAASFVDAACRRGEKSVYFAFEESPAQICRNMKSIGLDLERWVKKGLLQFVAARPRYDGLEMHLLKIHRAIEQMIPQVVVMDPVSNFTTAGTGSAVVALLMRIIDLFKEKQITALFTALTDSASPKDELELGVSSMMDIWILLHYAEQAGRRHREIDLLKSRGMSHSNALRRFEMTPRGIQLLREGEKRA